MTSQTYNYDASPLCQEKRDIRLLSIRPGNRGDPITVDIETTSLDETPSYSVLSYCWGPQDDLVNITISVRSFAVSRHLHHCLDSLRRQDDPLVIWVDAICIDQSSVQERNSQVALMRDIYKSAADLYIWLGRETPGLKLIFTSLQDFSQGRTDYAVETIEQLGSDLLKASPEDTADAFGEFVNLSWFRRTWIIQEVALPRKEPIIVCGEHRHTWKAMQLWWQLVEKFNATVKFHDELATKDPAWRRLHGNLRFRALDNLLSLREMLGDKGPFDAARGMPLSALIALSQDSLATDPRDKIYGIMGLAAADARVQISIDYAKSVGDVYEEATRYLIFAESKLNVLSCRSLSISRKPDTDEDKRFRRAFDVDKSPNITSSSWIRDFGHAQTSTHRQAPLLPEWHPRGAAYNASYHTKPKGPKDQKPGVLSIAGTQVGVIKHYQTAWFERPGQIQWFKNLEGALAVFFGACRPMAEDCAGGEPGATSLPEPDVSEVDASLEGPGDQGDPWHLMYQPEDGPVKPIHEAIWRTLVGDRAGATGTTSAPRAFGVFFDGLLEATRSERVPSMELSADFEGTIEEAVALWGVFQDRINTMMYRRAAFSTNEGWIGLGPDWMRPGDVVVVLSGGDVPFLLRPSGENRYSLVGDCYVEGIMGGELLKASLAKRTSGLVPGRLYNIV